MKKIVGLVTLLLVSCNNHSKNQNESVADNINMKTEKMKNIYYVNYNFTFPFEIAVNDMVVAKEMTSGMAGPERINHYILDNGEQLIKIKVFPPKGYNNGLLKQKDLDILEEQSAIYNVNSSTNDFDTVLPLKFNKIDRDLPFVEQEWKFKADLPFDLIGWKNSKDLTQWDKEELEKAVLDKFRELHDQLNSGS